MLAARPRGAAARLALFVHADPRWQGLAEREELAEGALEAV
jgi:hypothetical protein